MYLFFELSLFLLARFSFRLHEQLMKLQQNELDTLKQWLTKTEDRISNMAEVNSAIFL